MAVLGDRAGRETIIERPRRATNKWIFWTCPGSPQYFIDMSEADSGPQSPKLRTLDTWVIGTEVGIDLTYTPYYPYLHFIFLCQLGIQPCTIFIQLLACHHAQEA